MELGNRWGHKAALVSSLCLGLGAANVAEAQLLDIPGTATSVASLDGITVTLHSVRFTSNYSNVGHVFAGTYPSMSYSHTASGSGDPLWAVFSWGPMLFSCAQASPGGSGSGSGPASVPSNPGIYYLKARLTAEEFCGEHVPAGSEHQTPDNAAAVVVVWPNVDAPMFVDVKPEPAGNHCANGGQQIIVGRATKQNNAVTNPSFTSSYVCDGANGQAGQNGQDGASSLVMVSAEAAGANCAQGGTRIQTGLDLNGNGQLDDGNVTTSYVCNGAAGADGEDGKDGEEGQDGANSLVLVSDEPAGENCVAGGRKIETGIDLNGNGLLDDGNVTTSYVCHGIGGTAGHATVVAVSVEAAGENCPSGGQRIDVGLDLNGNGTPDDGNVSTSFVCNGERGVDGADGADGAAGKNGADGSGCSVGGSSSPAQGAFWMALMAGLVLRRRRRS